MRLFSENHLLGIMSVFLVIILWEAVVRGGIAESVFLPPPSVVLLNTVELILSNKLTREITSSMNRIFVGFGISIIIGLVSAILSYCFKVFEKMINPLVELIRTLAPLALLPLFMLIFGIGFSSKVAILVWVSWVPIFMNTLQGFKNVDSLFIKVAKSFGASRTQIITKLIIPSAAPYIITGLRLGMGSAFLSLVAAEMLGSNSGLGFFILEASQTFRIIDMYSAIVVIGIIGYLINWFFIMLSRKLTPWNNFTSGV